MAALAAGMALAAEGCGSGADRTARTPPSTLGTGGGPLVYVAVGASESVGMGADRPSEQAWPVVLHRTALPPGSVLVNLGVPGATVADALAAQLPPALARRPALATVWLNVNDIIGGVPAVTYERQLEALVEGLARGGETLVLVANTPAFDLLPVYRECRAAMEAAGCPPSDAIPWPGQVAAVVDDYNEAIERVTVRAGAVLVDLHDAGAAALRAGSAGSLVSTDGFHPSTAGHQAVAGLFAQALERALDGSGPAGRAAARP